MLVPGSLTEVYTILRFLYSLLKNSLETLGGYIKKQILRLGT